VKLAFVNNTSKQMSNIKAIIEDNLVVLSIETDDHEITLKGITLKEGQALAIALDKLFVGICRTCEHWSWSGECCKRSGIKKGSDGCSSWANDGTARII
jgi:hypothetical protein